MRSDLLSSYVSKFSSPFAAYLHEISMDGGGTTWGNSTDGPGAVTWIGGRHVLISHTNGFVEHVTLPAWDGWRFTDRPARSADVTGAYVWSWIEACLPDVAAWELADDEDDLD